MANLITLGDDTKQWMRMSNLRTEVFVEVLASSGSQLVSTDWEIDTVVWLAAHDQAIMGLGMVGFSVADLSWTSEQLDEQKAFLSKVVDGALAGLGWERLGYEPNTDWLFPRLEEFRQLIKASLRMRFARRPRVRNGDSFGTIGPRVHATRLPACPRMRRLQSRTTLAPTSAVRLACKNSLRA